MLLSRWRNVIRPRPTVNIHIFAAAGETWAGGSVFAAAAGETRFICIGRRTKWSQLDANAEERDGFISEPRRRRNRRGCKWRGWGGEAPSCSHGSQPLGDTPFGVLLRFIQALLWSRLCSVSIWFYINIWLWLLTDIMYKNRQRHNGLQGHPTAHCWGKQPNSPWATALDGCKHLVSCSSP